MKDFESLTVSQMLGVINQLPEPELWMSQHGTYDPPPCKVYFYEKNKSQINNSVSEYSFKIVEREFLYDWELIS